MNFFARRQGESVEFMRGGEKAVDVARKSFFREYEIDFFAVPHDPFTLCLVVTFQLSIHRPGMFFQHPVRSQITRSQIAKSRINWIMDRQITRSAGTKGLDRRELQY